MSPLIKSYVKTFLITGITFAILMSTADNFRGEPFSFAQFLFYGIGFGMFMSFILVTIHKEKLKTLGIEKYTDQNLGVKQQINVKSMLTEDQVLEKLKANPRTSMMQIQKESGGIRLETGFSWKSFGEHIFIRTESSQDEFEYEISSRPLMKMTLLDYGKNLENVTKVKEIILT